MGVAVMPVIKARRNKCELCGDVSELRPYGPQLEWICFKCGMKDEGATSRSFMSYMDDENLVVDTRIDPEN